MRSPPLTSAAVLVRRRSAVWMAAAVLVVALVVAVGLMPATTRQGVDYAVVTHELPLYLKALDFFDRHANYGRLARRVTAAETTDTGRALALMRWTRQNVRDVPAGLPVVDDHVWHIVIRGYGADDQKVDVFTTLATYAGVRAYWTLVGPRPGVLPIALVRADGRWRVLDVANGLAFRNARGELATAEEIAGDPGIVRAAAEARTYRGLPYTGLFDDFRPPGPAATLRAEKQMPWPRLLHETKRLVGLTPSDPDTAPVAAAR